MIKIFLFLAVAGSPIWFTQVLFEVWIPLYLRIRNRAKPEHQIEDALSPRVCLRRQGGIYSWLRIDDWGYALCDSRRLPDWLRGPEVPRSLVWGILHTEVTCKACRDKDEKRVKR